MSVRWTPNCPLREWSRQVRSTSGTRDLGMKGTQEEVAALQGGRKQKKTSSLEQTEDQRAQCISDW